MLQACGSYCLHPEDEDQQEAHTEACQQRYRRELSRSVSAQMECCICLEVSLGVLKPWQYMSCLARDP